VTGDDGGKRDGAGKEVRENIAHPKPKKDDEDAIELDRSWSHDSTST